MKKKKSNLKNPLLWRFGFGFLLIVVGVLLNVFKIGMQEFFSYNSVGTYLVYCGFLIFFIVTLSTFRKTKKVVDERAQKVAYYANRWTLSVVFLGGFILMILDGINPTYLRMSHFISYSICFLLLIYVAFYWLIDKRV